MDHRRLSIQFLRQSGLIPVKVRPGQKDPFSEFEPRTIAAEDHNATLLAIENDPSLNLGALFHGKYVDVDVDSNMPSLQSALEYFLPRTPYLWGRPSNPRSHRAYVLHEDFDRALHGPLLRYLKALKFDEGDVTESYSVEVRGGKPENGLFTVLPGSYRADKDEMVEWDGGVDPTVSAPHVPLSGLLRQIRLAVAAAIMANYFTAGIRNDLSLAYSGLLWRIRAASMASAGVETEDDFPPDQFFLSEDDARSIFTCIVEIADENVSDRRQRALNFQNTWRKLELDPTAKVTGGKVVAELVGTQGERVVRALYRLLSDNDGVEQLERLAEQFVVWYGQGVLIDLEMVRLGRINPWMTKEQATNSLGGARVKIGKKAAPLTAVLFNSSMIQRVAGLTFDPSTQDRIVPTEEGAMVNQWRGLAVAPCEQRVTDEEVEPFLSYVRTVLADGNEDIFKWVLGWCADLLQRPAEKPGTALVLVGAQGAGKTFLGEQVLGKIIGKAHYTQMNSISQLTDKFNSIADNKVFIQCDEAVHSYQKDVAAKLKSLITDETLTIEPKNVNSFKKPNHIHFLFTSNEENTAIFIDPSPHERRFTVLKVSKAKCNDTSYWTYMRAWTAMNLFKILRWLMDYKYDRQLIVRPIMTRAKQEIQRVGVDPEISWIIAGLQRGFPLHLRNHAHWWNAYKDGSVTKADEDSDTIVRDYWPDHVFLPQLEQDYRDFVRQHGRSVYTGSITTVLKKALPADTFKLMGQKTVSWFDERLGKRVKDRIRVHSFPSREAILEHLQERYGNIVDLTATEETNDNVVPITRTNEEVEF